MALLEYKTLHNAVTNTGTGSVLFVEKAEEVAVVISGSPTSFTAVFEVSLDGITYIPRDGNSADDFTTFISSTSTSGKGYEIDVGAYRYFRVNITAITPGSGNLTVVASSKT